MYLNDCFRYLNLEMPDAIRRHKACGNFSEAIRLIDRTLADPDTTEGMKKCLTAQREMITRYALDFPYTREEALAIAREKIPDFTEEEFDERTDKNQIHWIYIDGQIRYFDRFFSTVCKTDPSFAKRAGVVLPGAESGGAEHHLDRVMRIMKEKGEISNRIRIKATVRVKDEYFEPGMFVRAHLPIPKACDQQSEIVIESFSPAGAIIAPEDAPQRTICWETTLQENCDFTVTYSYVHKERYHDTETMHGDPVQPDFSTQEEPPHIMFTPAIRDLAATLTEGVTDPLEKARRFYDYITLKMHYTFQPAYFSLENIADSCVRNRTGDCGVLALLFLTLCRCVGIPAEWESGLTAEPAFIGAHDWVRFYIAPYGWLHADPSYGTGAVRMKTETRRRFYFGNLDAYRMVANRAFQAPFMPDKHYWRCDPYDNQLGEIETADRGLMYHEFIRSKECLLCEELD